MTILEAMQDAALFGRWFADPSWAPWRAALLATFGLLMSAAELATYQQATGRTTAPTVPAQEAWFVIGRRGGKSRVAALLAVYLACFREYRGVLAPGEVGTLPVIAADRRQARTVLRYITGFLEAVPLLKAMIATTTKESVELTNRVVIEVHTAGFRAIRGYTLIGAVCDEIAFWRSDDSANPDSEILAALRPGMATVPGAVLLATSSPYSRRGALWETYRRHYGQDDDPVLVWQAPTRTMNPGVSERVVREALASDEASAKAEYLAEFRVDIETFVSRELVDGCVVPDRRELPPLTETHYTAFVDPSGGAQDSMTLAVAHAEGDRFVLDAVRERRPPFSPADVVAEFTATLQAYRIGTVHGDRYAGEWPRERFAEHGIRYEPSGLPASDLYREFLPLLTSGQLELLDHARLLAQLVRLERRTGRSGRDLITHAPGDHDDVANVVAGALVTAHQAAQVPIVACEGASQVSYWRGIQ